MPRPWPLHLSRTIATPTSTIRYTTLHHRNPTTLRQASTSTSTPRQQPTRYLRALLSSSALLLLTTFSYIYLTDTRAAVHRYATVPLLRRLYPDAEDAHHAGIRYMQALYALNLHVRERRRSNDSSNDLRVEVFGEQLDNPMGTSAGIDKEARIPSALFALGPSIVEVGGATPYPQDGNPKPRVFRIASQNALVNRYGLNSEGAEAMAQRLRERVRRFAYSHGRGLSEMQVLNGEADVPPGSLQQGRLLAIQIAKNKSTPDADIAAVARDYTTCVRHLAPYADILVINVSSPNTPGLRDLQAAAPLTAILRAVKHEVQNTPRQSAPKIMVKVSPDEDHPAQIQGICQAVWTSDIDGVIVGNTTKRRPVLQSTLNVQDLDAWREEGGYSGPQMFERTLELVKQYRRGLDRRPAGQDSINEGQSPKVIFATGGITDGQQCLQILNAGASVCQIYTAMMYGGLGTVTRIKDEMKEAVKQRPS